MRVHVEGAKLLSLICGALDDAGIRSVLMWGSLLGHVRDGGIIPHDHDIDLNIFDHDIDKITLFERRLNDIGLALEKRTPYQMTVTFPRDTRLGIDIWVFYADGDDYTLYSFRKLGGLHHFKMPKALFQNCRPASFLGVPVSIPSRAEEVLDLAYGDWRIRRPDFSDDDAPCATVVGAYPVNDHSYPTGKGYMFWGRPLPAWPPYTPVGVGKRAPDARFKTTDGETWDMDGLAGDFVILGFFASFTHPVSRATLSKIIALRGTAPARSLRLFCITSDPPEVARHDLGETCRQGAHFIHDHDLKLARTFGVLPNVDTPDRDQDFVLSIIVVDPARYVVARFGFSRLDDEWPNLVKSIKAGERRRSYASPPLLFFPRLIDDEVRVDLLRYASTDRRAADLGTLRLQPPDLRAFSDWGSGGQALLSGFLSRSRGSHASLRGRRFAAA
ncbi:peroxiredoxin family protein [Lichenibacterium dinghuense]|uniref:peroxiredoxin family protein n=1 Tax=Lichenibacterium dinghuense TaxID=2895977 RepID=UPI001F163CDC|nr:LicD family protein [Lichenibacterium sp. 6Y81]